MGNGTRYPDRTVPYAGTVRPRLATICENKLSTAANLLDTVIRMEPCRPEEHPGGAADGDTDPSLTVSRP
eukprot:557211-Hanusia_phi.AAC.1